MRGLFVSLHRGREVCSNGMHGVVRQGICMLAGCLPKVQRWVECKGRGMVWVRHFYLYGVLAPLCGLCGILFTACSIKYSFTGASISPTTHTVSIGHFQNVAPIVNPTLASLVGEKLKERFITQTSLELVEQGRGFHGRDNGLFRCPGNHPEQRAGGAESPYHCHSRGIQECAG